MNVMDSKISEQDSKIEDFDKKIMEVQDVESPSIGD